MPIFHGAGSKGRHANSFDPCPKNELLQKPKGILEAGNVSEAPCAILSCSPHPADRTGAVDQKTISHRQMTRQHGESNEVIRKTRERKVRTTLPRPDYGIFAKPVPQAERPRKLSTLNCPRGDLAGGRIGAPA